MAVGNVKDAPLEMFALAMKDMRLTPADLQARIMYHYRQDVLRQFYRILGSADFIGNPVGLFTNVSSGVADIFYEPFTGAVMHGNRDLGVGIAKVCLFILAAILTLHCTRELPVSSRRLFSAFPTA
jgi:vacuolar protein sorting-associated protein 13A/C